MCGICGLIGPGQTSNDLKALRQLIYICALRGSDSTGFVTVSTGLKGEIRIWKDKVPSAYALWQDAKTKRPMMTSLLPSLYMAHCRDATIGKVTAENSHPFRAGNLIGMHNGTLRDSEFLGKGRTDSEEMFIAMSTKGIQPVLEGLDARSAFAISVYDKAKKKVYFARSQVNKRPLFFAVHTKRRVVFYASEKEMLDLVLKRNNIDYKIFEAKAETLYSINPDDIVGGDELPLDETPLKLQEPSVSDFNWGAWGEFSDVPWTESYDLESNVTGQPNVITVNPSKPKTSVPALNENQIPDFLKSKRDTFHGCMFCRSILTQAEEHHCRHNPERGADGKSEVVWMCTDCRGVYEGVSTSNSKVSAM